MAVTASQILNNTLVGTSMKLWFSLGLCPGVGLLGHMVVLFLVF